MRVREAAARVERARRAIAAVFSGAVTEHAVGLWAGDEDRFRAARRLFWAAVQGFDRVHGAEDRGGIDAQVNAAERAARDVDIAWIVEKEAPALIAADHEGDRAKVASCLMALELIAERHDRALDRAAVLGVLRGEYDQTRRVDRPALIAAAVLLGGGSGENAKQIRRRYREVSSKAPRGRARRERAIAESLTVAYLDSIEPDSLLFPAR